MNQVDNDPAPLPADATNGNVIYREYFEFSTIVKMNSRTVTDIIDVFGAVGGVVQSMALIFAFFLSPWAEMCYKMEAITHLCLFSDAKNITSQITFNLYDKVILYF